MVVIFTVCFLSIEYAKLRNEGLCAMLMLLSHLNDATRTFCPAGATVKLILNSIDRKPDANACLLLNVISSKHFMCRCPNTYSFYFRSICPSMYVVRTSYFRLIMKAILYTLIFYGTNIRQDANVSL